MTAVFTHHVTMQQVLNLSEMFSAANPKVPVPLERTNPTSKDFFWGKIVSPELNLDTGA